MHLPLILAFKRDVYLEQANSSIVLQTPKGKLEFKDCSSGLQKALQILANEGATQEYFSEFLLQAEGIQALAKFNFYLKKFLDIGIICYSFQADGSPFATIIPISPAYKFQFLKPEKDRKYVLSRFAYCHSEQNQMVLESPLTHAQIVLADWRGGAIISALAQPQSCSELLLKIPHISELIIQTFLGILLSLNILQEWQDNSLEDPVIAQWEFHDLLFHTKTRKGMQAKPDCKTYRFKDKIPPLPAIKFQPSNHIIPLHKPNIDNLKKVDIPFTWVMEERKSIYSYGNQPITDKQLGEFLYRSARVRNIFRHNLIEYSNRPYPSGGACYALELYITINVCENISPGLYHYCPQKHQLNHVCTFNSLVQRLVQEAGSATGKPNLEPQILITIAARFSRVSWMYESVAYALILKEVGTLFQTMYLVATAMGLTPCALGGGNADIFAETVGTDYYSESSVGEFILGSQVIN